MSVSMDVLLLPGLRDYALTSALRDHRFAPVGAKEVASLRCTVSLLCCFERAAQWDDWQVRTRRLAFILCNETIAAWCRRQGVFVV